MVKPDPDSITIWTGELFTLVCAYIVNGGQQPQIRELYDILLPWVKKHGRLPEDNNATF